jgi:hypothetical protein
MPLSRVVFDEAISRPPAPSGAFHAGPFHAPTPWSRRAKLARDRTECLPMDCVEGNRQPTVVTYLSRLRIIVR